jgi:thiamine pyrophosphate-dependent acetolactate synthase large subunit-like protein
VPLFRASQVDEVVREAFFRARAESRPIFLNAPMDVQQETYEDDPNDYLPSSALRPHPQRIQPDPDRLREAARLLAESQKPVIVIGQGAARADAEGAIRLLADRIGALYATTLPMKGWLNDSPYYAGIAGLYATRTAMELFGEADCVIGVGASLNQHTLEGGYLFPSARYIHVDLRPNLVMGNGRTADVFLQGDARLTVETLEQLLAQEGVSSSGFRTPEVRSVLSEYDPDPREFDLEPGTLDPRRAVALLDEALPAEVGTVMGNAHSSAIASHFMTKRREVQWYTSAFGCIGQTFPTALGGAVALAPRPMAVVDGDASVIMHIGELDTAVRLRAKLLLAVLNDQALGAEYQKFVSKRWPAHTAEITTPDLGLVARAFGCRGQLITELDDIKPAVEEFLAGDGPMLLDIRVSKTVASVPYRRMHFGEDI